MSNATDRPAPWRSAPSDIPTQKGFYVELTEAFTTNISLIASTNNNYNLDLVETRQRDSFTKDGRRITVYVGNIGEKYNGVDFSGASVREVIYCPIAWHKNSHHDNVGQFMFFSPSVISALLENNKGDSTWTDTWRPLSSVPGIYIKRTADKSRLAIAYGASENEIHRLEFRMVEPAGNPVELISLIKPPARASMPALLLSARFPQVPVPEP